MSWKKYKSFVNKAKKAKSSEELIDIENSFNELDIFNLSEKLAFENYCSVLDDLIDAKYKLNKCWSFDSPVI